MQGFADQKSRVTHSISPPPLISMSAVKTHPTRHVGASTGKGAEASRRWFLHHRPAKMTFPAQTAPCLVTVCCSFVCEDGWWGGGLTKS